jgi:2-hydroxy-3-keto-5-methylthiopentenyl-1-phosphate phosphatase
MTRPWAIVCDFDGTALAFDLGDAVAHRFAGEAAYQRAEELFRAGRSSFGVLLRAVFAPITASREEIAAFALERAAWRPGFEDFLSACAGAGVRFLIVSAGLDAYIEPVLARLPAPLRRHLELRANRAECSPTGLAVAFHGPDCGFCGACKGEVVHELQRAGHRVLVLGDGAGDRCAAEAGDLVFARAGSSLVGWCRQRGLPHHEFSTFHEVLARVPELAGAAASCPARH